MTNQIEVGDKGNVQKELEVLNQGLSIQKKFEPNFWTISTIILLILLVVSSTAFFINTRTQKDNSGLEISKVVTPVPSEVPTGTKMFKSKYLSLNFQYSSDWGQVEEVLRPGMTGKRYDLTFDGDGGTSAPGFGWIVAGGRTKDFTEGRGGYIADVANGFSSPQELCNSYFGKQGVNCEVINPNVVVQLVAPKYDDVCPPNPGQYWFSKRVWLNLPGQEVTGFVLEYANFWSNQFTDMYSQDLDCALTNKDKFTLAVSRIVQKLQSGNVDQVTKDNLIEFQNFVNSISIQ